MLNRFFGKCYEVPTICRPWWTSGAEVPSAEWAQSQGQEGPCRVQVSLRLHGQTQHRCLLSRTEAACVQESAPWGGSGVRHCLWAPCLLQKPVSPLSPLLERDFHDFKWEQAGTGVCKQRPGRMDWEPQRGPCVPQDRQSSSLHSS